MLSGTRREKDNANDVKTCSTCHLRNGIEPCSPCAEFIALEAKISQTEILLMNLIQNQENLRIDINRSHEPMIHRLPNELASRILEFCLPSSWLASESSEIGANSNRPDMYAALHISSVCRAWRDIAMDNPRWWRVVPIFISDQFDRHWRTLENVEEWLRRAGDTHPLSFHVWANKDLKWSPPQCGWEPKYYPPDLRFINGNAKQQEYKGAGDIPLLALFALINTVSHRWKNIDIGLSVQDHAHAIKMLCGNNDDAPVLNKLRLRPFPLQLFKSWPHGTFMLGINSVTKGFTRPAPSVVEIARLKQVEIDWHNLTSIDWHDFDWKECLVMFREAKGLVECHLGYPIRTRAISGGHNMDRESPVTCSSLRSLKIGGDEKRVIAKFWDLLTVPGLESLKTTSYGSSLPLQNIKNMLDSSSSLDRLTSLTLGYSYSKPGNDEQLLGILRQAHNLTVLRLEISIVPMGIKMYPDINTLCWFLLTESDDNYLDQQIVLPNLTNLTILNVPVNYGPGIQWSAITDLFQSPPDQNYSKRPLTTLCVWFSNLLGARGNPWSEVVSTERFYIDKESTERFLEIVDEGEVALDLQIPHPKIPGERRDLLQGSIEHHGIIGISRSKSG